MELGDYYGVYLNPSIYDQIDSQDAFENYDTVKNISLALDSNELGVMEMEFYFERCIKEMIYNLFQPFTSVFVQIFEGEIGVQNRTMEFMSAASLFGLLMLSINIFQFTSLNENLYFFDLLVLDLFQSIQKVIIGIKYGFLNPNEQDQQNMNLLSFHAKNENLLISWLQPNVKYLHLMLTKGEFQSGINMSKEINILFTRDVKDIFCNINQEELEVILKIKNQCKVNENSLNLRVLSHIIVFNTKIKFDFTRVITFVLSQTLIPVFTRLYFVGLPIGNNQEIIVFALSKLFSMLYLTVSLIFLEAAVLDLERRTNWMENVSRMTSPNGHSEIGIFIPLNTTNNILCQLSLMTQIKMVGLQFQNRLQRFTAIQVYCTGLFMLYSIQLLGYKLIFKLNFDQASIQILCEIFQQSFIISILLTSILSMVGVANSSTQLSITILNRNILYLQHAIFKKKIGQTSHITTNEEIHQSDNTNINISSEKYKINSEIVNQIKFDETYHIQDKHTEESTCKLTGLDQFNNIQVGLEEIGTDVSNHQHKLKSVNECVSEIELEQAVHMCEKLAVVLNEESVKYPFSILGMTEETIFVNSMISVVGTIATLIIGIYFNL